MEFKKPVLVYAAATNVDAHMIVEMLETNGVPAHAVEDQAGVFCGFGTVSQLYKPNVWVDEETVQKAAELIREFEAMRRSRKTQPDAKGNLSVNCEKCGKTSSFPGSLDGTTQECRYRGAYVDVGELPWDDDFGESDV
jgi:hypothetical protein